MSTDSLLNVAACQPGISALAFLRRQTAPLHAQVEAAISLEAALHSLTTYQLLLQRYSVLFRAFETELQRHASLLARLAGYSYQPRLPLLERDLAAPAFPSLLADTARSMPVLPLMADLDSLLGVLYVVEGSALGGQYIYREILQKLHLDSASGSAFFYGIGEHTGAAWKHFTLLLDRHIVHPERAATAAASMFHTFQLALQTLPEAPTA